MERSIDAYQSRIDGARLVRDLSGSILIGASTVATGGGALIATAGMGTVIKTTAGSSIGNDAWAATSAKSDLSDQISFEDELLLKLAVIDMAKGVGRGWW